jgi:hypothetical protein
MANGKSFIDFILDAKDNRDLVVTFMQLANAEDFKKFFADNGYDIKEDEIGKVIEARKFLAGISRPQDDDRY